MAVLAGIAFSALTFLPLGLLAERFNFRRWFQAVAVLTGVLALVVIAAWFYAKVPKTESGWMGWVFLRSSMCLFFVGSFFVYLGCLGIWRRVFP
jgi:hypothetical protein